MTPFKSQVLRFWALGSFNETWLTLRLVGDNEVLCLRLQGPLPTSPSITNRFSRCFMLSDLWEVIA